MSRDSNILGFLFVCTVFIVYYLNLLVRVPCNCDFSDCCEWRDAIERDRVRQQIQCFANSRTYKLDCSFHFVVQRLCVCFVPIFITPFNEMTLEFSLLILCYHTKIPYLIAAFSYNLWAIWPNEINFVLRVYWLYCDCCIFGIKAKWKTGVKRRREKKNWHSLLLFD